VGNREPPPEQVPADEGANTLIYPQRPYHRVLFYQRRRKRSIQRRIRHWHHRRR
jgi:hypothetical protein